jgi:hypothetical protein
MKQKLTTLEIAKIKEDLLSRRNAKAFPGLSLSGGVQVPTGTKLHDKARVVRSFKLGIQSGEERVIKHTQNLLLHFSPLQLLPYGKRFFVHHLHGVQALRQPHHRVPNLTEVHVPEVSAAEAAEEPEVVEPHSAYRAPEPPHGFPCGLVGLVGLVGA